MTTSHGFRDLRVYQLAFTLATEIFKESNTFHLRKDIPLLIKFDAHREVSPLISVKAIARSVTRKCLLTRWRTLMEKPPRLRYG
jgi:hypothetical protein